MITKWGENGRRKNYSRKPKKIRRERRDALRLTKNILDNNKENTTIQSKKLIMTIIIGIYVKILLVCRIAFSVYVIQIYRVSLRSVRSTCVLECVYRIRCLQRNDRQKFVSFVSRFCTNATQLISKYQRTIISFSINHDLNKNVNVSLRRMKCMSVNVFI